MALETMEFTFAGNAAFHAPKDWSHSGVVGSGDLEILIDAKEQDGKVSVKVTTPVTGFANVWEKVLGKFIIDAQIGNLAMEINDNNATPFIATLRLGQAVKELEEGGTRS